jgi:hypothetical protein
MKDDRVRHAIKIGFGIFYSAVLLDYHHNISIVNHQIMNITKIYSRIILQFDVSSISTF